MPKLFILGFEDWAPKSGGGLQPNGSRLLVERVELETTDLLTRLEEIGLNVELVLGILPAKLQGNILSSLNAVKAKVMKIIAEGLGPEDYCIVFGQGNVDGAPFEVEANFGNIYAEPKNKESPMEFKFLSKDPTVGMGMEVVKKVVSSISLNPNLRGLVKIGNNPGTYNCNYVGRVMYELMADRSMFVHVPFCTDEDHARYLYERHSVVMIGKGISSSLAVPVVRADLVTEFVIAAVRTMAMH